ncbi:MAG: hypothetical protein HeimC3_02860 [Candidatus Heimdallarchaeota archaeon LC_3]|nr:MAG: hypothetical protein HeimC3_02860 [Candidatus Heimdallarchaeota archaeon LC_3]
MSSVQSLYCSLCGNRVTEVDVRINRKSGIIICNSCLLRQTEDDNNCPDDYLTLEEMKSLIIRDFIEIKSEIREVALLPVAFAQDMRYLQNQLLSLENEEKIIPNSKDFTPKIDLEMQLSKIDTFLTHYLQDFSPSLAYLFREVIAPLNRFFLDPLRIQSCQMRIKIISDRLKMFRKGTEERCKPLFDDVQNFNTSYRKYLLTVKRLKKFFKNTTSILTENEKIIHFSSIHRLYGTLRTRKMFILITTSRIMFFIQKRNLIFKKYKLINSIENFELKEVQIREKKRFKKRILKIITNSENIRLTGSRESIKNIKNVITNFSLNETVFSVSDWKLWVYGWSPEQFRLNVYQLINNTNENSNNVSLENEESAYQNVFFNSPNGFSNKIDLENNNEENSGIKKYFKGQIEKVQEQIQICQYFLQDLVDRRSELQLSEYYQMYESFSIKLRNLEDERDSIIKQYEKLIPFMYN